MKSFRFKRAIAVIGVLAFGMVVLAACGDTPRAVASSASCGFIVGDGQDGRDTKLHKVEYPGQNLELDNTGGSQPEAKEKVSYVPCNLRDYIVTNGVHKNANGGVIGDRSNPSVGYTDSGVQIKVASTVNWTLNQTSDALKAFYALCFKFSCASGDDKGGSVNSSTPGWNNMLGETMSFVVDKLVFQGSAARNDDIWRTHSASERQALAAYMANHFADTMRPYSGYNGGNMFCGPGSAWKNPENPGAKGNVFNCTAVTISVDDVQRGQVSNTDGTSGAEALNKQRLENAKALYGDSAPQVLAILDEIAACKASNTVCVFGGNGAVPAIPAGSSGSKPSK